MFAPLLCPKVGWTATGGRLLAFLADFTYLPAMSDAYEDGGDGDGGGGGGGGRRLPRMLVLGLAWIVSTAFVVTVVLRHMRHEGLLNEPAVAARLVELKAYRDDVKKKVKTTTLKLTKAEKEMSDDELDLGATAAKAKTAVLDGLEKWLPYFSEGALLLLIGLGLGMASRMVVKVVLLVALLGFVGLQYFAYQGMMEVQWGDLASWFHHTVLNAAAGSDWLAMLKAKTPAVGAAGVGYFLGLRS